MPPPERIDPAFLLYRAGRFVSTALPDPVLWPAASVAAMAVARLGRRRRKVVWRNLVRVVGEREAERAVDEAFRSYARYWMEALRLPKGTAELGARTSVEGLDYLARFLDAGRGVVFVGPHLGSYDLAGAWLASRGWRVLAVAEELRPPPLFELFCRLRASVGVEVLPAGRASTARALLAGLRGGAAVGLVADRDVSGSGIEVEFFGETTYLPNGPAVLALRTGAPIVVGALFQRPGGRWHAVALPPLEVGTSRSDPVLLRQVTQEVARRMEDLIRREPGQWHLFQPNWPSDPGYERLRTATRHRGGRAAGGGEGVAPEP